MNRKIPVIAVVAVTALMGARADVVAQYDSGVSATAGASGAANPTSGTGVNAWTEDNTGPSIYCGGVDTGNGGWNVTDGTTGARVTYLHNLSAQEQTDLTAGYTASVTLALNHDAVRTDTGTTGSDNYYTAARQGAIVFYVDVAGRRNILVFDQDDSNNVTVNGNTVDTGGGALLGLSEQLGSGAPDMEFATFYLTWVAVTGISTLTDNFGNSYAMSSSGNSGNTIAWGSGSTGGQGSAVFNNLSVTAIPEPAAIGLISLFGGGMLYVRRKWMT